MDGIMDPNITNKDKKVSLKVHNKKMKKKIS